jgi:hypothetical protein
LLVHGLINHVFDDENHGGEALACCSDRAALPVPFSDVGPPERGARGSTASRGPSQAASGTVDEQVCILLPCENEPGETTTAEAARRHERKISRCLDDLCVDQRRYGLLGQVACRNTHGCFDEAGFAQLEVYVG